MKIIGDINCVVSNQVRFPKSKKRRIRKKWADRNCNGENTPIPDVYVMKKQGLIIGHPSTIAELTHKIRDAETKSCIVDGSCPMGIVNTWGIL